MTARKSLLVMRPIAAHDLHGLELCAAAAETGMIHLPKCREELKKKIDISVQAFAAEITRPGPETYLFALADVTTQHIGGTCAIIARTGLTAPFYVYRLNRSLAAPRTRRPTTLRVKRYQHRPSELCGLYLSPQNRGEGIGKLLSLSRFLFIAAQPQRFSPLIIASLCGVTHNTCSPFWDGLGRQHCNLTLEEVMYRRSIDEHSLGHILPQYPIDISSLPHEAASVMGMTQAQSKPAYDMLIGEGFSYREEIDPVDGGPIVTAKTAAVRTIQNSILSYVERIVDLKDRSERCILSNNRLDFRATYASIQKSPTGSLMLDAATAEALEVAVGDSVRYLEV